MPTPMEHAHLSPSASSRWMACPASIRMEHELREQVGVSSGDSGYAREGTLAHALAEIEASKAFGLVTREQYEAKSAAWAKEFAAEGYGDGELEEMEGHVRGYVELLQQRVARVKGSSIRLEQKLETGIPGCWGTSDAIIVSDEHIEVVDLKYGTGVRVEAQGNTQLRLYGLGAMRLYEELIGRPKFIYMTIYQPRLSDVASTERMTRMEMVKWKKDVALPAALATEDPDAPFGPSEKACRFCPASGVCRARIDWATALDFSEPYAEEEPEARKPEALTPEEMGRVLERLPAIRSWADAVEAFALSAMYSGTTRIPGWKVVMSRGRRTITDHAHAIQTLIDAGFNAEQVAQFKTKPIGTLEKLVGREDLKKVLGPLLTKTEGKESLVPETDPRPSIQAGDDFKGLEIPE